MSTIPDPVLVNRAAELHKAGFGALRECVQRARTELGSSNPGIAPSREPRGDCLPCCIEFMFRIRMPHFVDQEEAGEIADWWFDGFVPWCQKALGMLPWYIDSSDWHPPGVHITVGESPRGSHHAVVYDGGAPLFDPGYPLGTGIAKMRGFYLLHTIYKVIDKGASP